MANEPEVGSLDLETPCCIQLGGERCGRHGPAVERPAPEGCAGCAARDALAALVRALDNDRGTYGAGNAPGHGHSVPGVWDSDNGPLLRNKPCAYCAAYFRAQRVLAAPASPKENRRHE